jgi:hypothetical protein
MFLDIRNGKNILVGSQASPACPSDKCSIMEHWWNDTDRRKRNTGRRTCPKATKQYIGIQFLPHRKHKSSPITKTKWAIL